MCFVLYIRSVCLQISSFLMVVGLLMQLALSFANDAIDIHLNRQEVGKPK